MNTLTYADIEDYNEWYKIFDRRIKFQRLGFLDENLEFEKLRKKWRKIYKFLSSSGIVFIINDRFIF